MTAEGKQRLREGLVKTGQTEAPLNAVRRVASGKDIEKSWKGMCQNVNSGYLWVVESKGL